MVKAKVGKKVVTVPSYTKVVGGKQIKVRPHKRSTSN